MGFKKGIKREVAAYPSLKDERYFDGFKRSLFIVAKTHECSEVHDPNYSLGSEPEEKGLFEAKQTFMFSVFNANLQTDMGKTIVRRHLASTDAQAVWKELGEHMRTSSKEASEKRRLTQYVTNTVLDDNFKGTAEQFVVHFNEQFRQLEEISELQGLDVVQCAALVQTSHGIVNLIMNEYACYGKGHTIHSSGQIEWFKNSVDDRSVQVGGKQRICTIDGYAMPLTCRGGLMYLSILGKPTDQDLERYPAVHLTGPHEWDPSVLDYTHPSDDGEPPWSNDPDESIWIQSYAYI